MLPCQHTWGPTIRVEQTLGLSWWHWCKCERCGADGFAVTRPDGTVTQGKRCWQPCDAVEVK